MDRPKQFHLGNLGLPSPTRRKSLARVNGGRNIGLPKANVQIQTLSGNQQQLVSPYTGISNESGQVGAIPFKYSTSGEVYRVAAPNGVRRHSVTRSHVNGPHYVLPLETPHQKIVPLGGGKKRRSARRKTRKSLRHSHRRK
jgi:hypothetical protein